VRARARARSATAKRQLRNALPYLTRARAQNADEDSSSALAGGLSKLAQQLARGELPAAAGVSGIRMGGVGGSLHDGGRPVVLLVSDDARLARLVGQLAAAGVATVAASSRGLGGGGGGGGSGGTAASVALPAGVLLDWDAVRYGEYACE
jgi:hypothetical protein